MAGEHPTARPASGGFPEGEVLEQQLRTRQRRAVTWSAIFLASTVIGIIALVALLYNIFNSAFGLVAIQNEVDPDAIVLALEEQQLLALPNLQASEDDDVLAAGVASSPNAVGFFGYAYYHQHADTLRLVDVEGVTPGRESIDAGDYPLARPLYIYTTANLLRQRPELAAFVNYYLRTVNAEVGEVGYFGVGEAIIAEGLAALQASAPDAAATGEGLEGDITLAGSSTVFPLSQRIADGFAATGFAGAVNIDSIGTKAGIVAFCEGRVDIANASRPMTRQELELCRKSRREPIGFRVGADALAVVVNNQNTFLDNITIEQLRQVFGETATWSEIDASWPDAPIERWAPGADSGTLDFFVEAIFPHDLDQLPKETLVEILEANVSRNLMRRFENDQPFAERSRENVLDLVYERVVRSTVVDTWSLYDSIFRRPEIEAAVLNIPNGELKFRSWVSAKFLTSPQSSRADMAGIRSALLGSLWVILITLLVALPVGVGAAIYLEEYAEDNWFNRLISTNISNLAGVPSIIYGMLGLAIFVRAWEPLTSGSLLGGVDPTTANGRTIISASLTLALLVLPLIIINAQEAIRSVPRSLREAGFGLGATKWQVIWSHVLPSALPGILTGNILAMSRAIGETAPLVVVGASTFIAVDPSGPFSKFTTLPVQIYQWTSRPQDEFRNLAAAAILVLLVLLLSLNAAAVLLRNRFSKIRV
jgi:phosphate transport system permease protein